MTIPMLDDHDVYHFLSITWPTNWIVEYLEENLVKNKYFVKNVHDEIFVKITKLIIIINKRVQSKTRNKSS